MKLDQALIVLNDFDMQGKYVYRKADLRTLFDESGAKLDQTINRLVEKRVLERAAHGVYVFALSKHIDMTTIEHIANSMRRGALNYESLESALSQYGVISQVPLDRITLMTTGRSGEYATPYGIIEFVHTKQQPNTILSELRDREGHPLPIATKKRAYRDLVRSGRNLGLVDKEELDV